METWNKISDWQNKRKNLNGSIGFVATMGALHIGHISLVERARKENDIVVASIFVNPTQFNDPKDLERYPRTLETDLKLLSDAGVDHVVFPTNDQIYPSGYRFKIDESELSQIMEGKYRPGFFQGVMTVVMKLLNFTQPHKAYFGEKDFQQMTILKQMTEDFFMPIEIIPCETIREQSGLAYSSRNELLTPAARKSAAVIYQALTESANVEAAKQQIKKGGLEPEYVEEHFGRRFASAFLEGVRLIDNVPLKRPN